MLWQAWRIVALILAVVALALVAGNLATPSSSPGFRAKLVGRGDVSRVKVVSIDARRDVNPDVRVGDVLRLHDDTFSERMRYQRQRVGDTFVYDRAGSTPVTIRLLPAPERPFAFAFLAIVIAFIAVGTLLAVRRPQLPEARALSAMLLLFSITFAGGPQSWMPEWVVGVMLIGVSTVQFAGLGYAVHLSTIFPERTNRGWRAWIRRVNPVVTALYMLLGVWLNVGLWMFERTPARPVAVVAVSPWLYYITATAIAFAVAGRGAAPADRTRIRWVGYSLALGFAGPLVATSLLLAGHGRDPWVSYLNLTLVAIPLGLGYAIVRHRVIDIGFVINRALVFGSVSGIVVIAFMALEWLLGGVLVKVSHLTSSSLELGLALVLGFSLRGIHQRVDTAVDDIFFRARHEADRALRTLAREVAYVTDPRVAIERVHAELVARTGGASAAVYVVDGPHAVRADRGESAAAELVDIDDPALVRMRATRTPVALRELGSGLTGDRAFPMCVRDAVTGAVVLGPKTSGEAYAPDEIATIEAVATALGNALDALQTAALKAEIARVLVHGAPLDALRLTVDSAAWVRGAAPQPAGSFTGLVE